MIARINRIALFAIFALLMGFTAVTFSGCPSADDDDSAAAGDDDDSAAAGDDDDSAVAGDDDDSASSAADRASSAADEVPSSGAL